MRDLNGLLKVTLHLRDRWRSDRPDTHLPACFSSSLAVLGPRCPPDASHCAVLKTWKHKKHQNPLDIALKHPLTSFIKKKLATYIAAATAAPEGSSHYHSNAVSLMCCLLLVSFVGTAGFSSSWDGGFTVLWEIKNVGLGFNLKLSAQLWPRMKELPQEFVLRVEGWLTFSGGQAVVCFMSSSFLGWLSARIKTFISLIIAIWLIRKGLG